MSSVSRAKLQLNTFRLPFLELGIVNDGTDVPVLDEAIIWGSDTHEIIVRGPNAGRLAQVIVDAVNVRSATK